MAMPRKTLEAVLRAQGSIAFRDLERLVFRLGFRLDRVSGSHHIYVHPKVRRPLNFQPIGKDAKLYQVRQLRDIIIEFGLTLEEK